MGLPEVGINADRFSKMVNGFFELAPACQDNPKAVVRLSEFRFQLKCQRKIDNGFVALTLPRQKISQVKVSISKGRLELKCHGIMVKSLSNPSLVLENISQVVVGSRKIGLQLQGLGKMGYGLFCFPFHEREHFPGYCGLRHNWV